MPAIRSLYLSPLSFRRFSFAAIGILIFTSFRRFSLAAIGVLLFASFGSLIPPSASAGGGRNAVPYIDRAAPVSANPGATGVTLTVLGTGFVATSVVKCNSISLTHMFM